MENLDKNLMSESEIKDIFIKTGAILHGHFLLTSGLHSDTYIEKFSVLKHPKFTEILCKEMAKRYINDNVELVIGPMTGGILLAHEVGKALNTEAIFCERENGKMTLKRGFEIQKNQRVLIVEDIVTTGGSIKEVVEVVKSFGGNIIGIVMLVNRSGKELIFDGVKSKALLNLNVSTYKADECELCKKNTPLTKRGRTGK